jgi:hypothetical protein
MLFYPAALPLSRRTLTYTAGIIRRHRKRIGSPWRKLGCGRQALLVLAYVRKGETFAELAAGFGVGTATAWRYVTETVALLAARSPRLRRALRDARKAGHAYLVIDGTVIPVDRVAADRPFYSGKHRKHGMNLQVIASPDGDIVWVSGPLPGAVHDLTAARIWGIIAELAASGLVVLADKGYTGAGDHVRVPYKGKNKPASQKDANRAHARLRGPGERANAQLKSWRILRKLRCCPWRAGQLAKAIHVLQSPRNRRIKKFPCTFRYGAFHASGPGEARAIHAGTIRPERSHSVCPGRGRGPRPRPRVHRHRARPARGLPPRRQGQRPCTRARRHHHAERQGMAGATRRPARRGT